MGNRELETESSESEDKHLFLSIVGTWVSGTKWLIYLLYSWNDQFGRGIKHNTTKIRNKTPNLYVQDIKILVQNLGYADSQRGS